MPTWPTCPATAPVKGAACPQPQEGITCVYSSRSTSGGTGTTAYTCDNCDGNLCEADNIWYVSDLAAACPDEVPNWGSSCSIASLTCNYDVRGGELVCSGGQLQLRAVGRRHPGRLPGRRLDAGWLGRMPVGRLGDQ